MRPERRVLRCSLLVAHCSLLVLLLAAPAHAAIGVDDLRRAAETALQPVERARNAPGADQAAAARQAYDALQPVRNQPLVMPDGRQITVKLPEIDATLTRNPPDLNGAAAALNSLLRTLPAPSGTPGSAPPANAEQQLKDVLARPEYQTGQPSDDFREAIARFLATIGQWLAAPFVWLWSLLAGAPLIVQIAVGIVGALVVAGLIALLSLRWRRGFAPAKAGPKAKRPADVPATASDAWLEAQRLAADGDLRAAIRRLYLACLLALDEANRLRFDRALTNREVLRAVRDDPTLHGQLVPIVGTFDQVWYGHTHPPPATYEDYRERVAAVLGRDLAR